MTLVQQIEDMRERVASVLRSLTYTEERLLRAVVEALPAEDGGCVVTSRIADTFRGTRSTVVTALQKLQAAGLADVHSMGMKGTHIKLIGTTRSELLQRLARTA